MLNTGVRSNRDWYSLLLRVAVCTSSKQTSHPESVAIRLYSNSSIVATTSLWLSPRVYLTMGSKRRTPLYIHAEVVRRDADGRRELDELHRQAQTAFAARNSSMDQQPDLLEQERRNIAEERIRAPVVAEAVKFGAGLIVCLTPLVVVVYLLRCLRSDDGVDAAMFEVLIDEISSEQPRLFRAQPESRALPGPSANSGGP